MSSLLAAELAAACSALGSYDTKKCKYLIDDFTTGTVKDLIRFLRRDGEDHEIRRYLGESKIIQTDLIPMLIDHWEREDLFDMILRLMVNLTNPALALYREEIPTDRSARHFYLQILMHLQTYKKAFTKDEIWEVFRKKLKKVLEIHPDDRDDDTGLAIERILILIRNILHIPTNLDEEKRPDNDASVHDQVLWALNRSGILDIILYMTSENERRYSFYILEIMMHLLREQNATSLASASVQRSDHEKLQDERELLSVRLMEMKKKNDKVRQYSGSRHSRFGGTYVVKNMKSISENDLICFKPYNKIANLDFGNKIHRSIKPKNRRPEEPQDVERRSAVPVRLFLKEFCIELLNGSYNLLMHHAKDTLARANFQQNDESYYLWAVRFFMEFNRGHKCEVGLVSETVAVTMFHYIQQQIEKYLEMIQTEKKKYHVWVKRLHLALKAYKELLHTLMAMDKSKDQSVRDSGKVLKSNVFYVIEYREFIVHLVHKYDDNKMSMSYLKDLIETIHIFLKMLENYCKTNSLVVQKKVRSKTHKKSAKKKVKSQPIQNERNVDIEWEEIGPQISAVLRGDQILNTNYLPFDAASSVPIDEQKGECMKTIQKLLIEKKYEDSIALLRSARDVWSEEIIFGHANMNIIEEYDMLQTIFKADIGLQISENPIDPGSNDSDTEDEQNESNVTSAKINEIDFNFKDFIHRFANPNVVSAYALVLENFDKNKDFINHCCLKMLHRIAWDCKYPSMMFQASLFHCFQRILETDEHQYEELRKFALFIIRAFSKLADNNAKIFMELLFWKDCRDADEIEHGYTTYNKHLDKGQWTEEEQEELRRLYMENQQNPATDMDVIDWITENLINQTRTRRSVIRMLKELGLIFKAPTKKSNALKKRDSIPVEFGENEDELLKDLWNQFSATINPIGAIAVRMPFKRPKHRYIDRLLELGLISDKNECKTKRIKSNKSELSKSNLEPGDCEDSLSEKSDESSSSDSDDDNVPVIPKQINKKKPANLKQNLVTSKQIALSLIDSANKGFIEALKWLAESLVEVALDQEAEGFNPESEGIPLVPISAQCVEAMEDDTFQNALRLIGMEPPNIEQEIYWRVPATLHFSTLRKRSDVIIRAADRNLKIPKHENTNGESVESEEKSNTDPEVIFNVAIEGNNNMNNDSEDEDVFDKIRKMNTNNKQINFTNSETQRNRGLKRKRKNNILAEGSDDEEGTTSHRTLTVSQHTIPNCSDGENGDQISFVSEINQINKPETSEDSSNDVQVVKRIARTIHSDDSDDSLNETVVSPISINKLGKPHSSMNGENTGNKVDSTLLSNSIGSDEDDDFASQKVKRKKMLIIDDDSD